MIIKITNHFINQDALDVFVDTFSDSRPGLLKPKPVVGPPPILDGQMLGTDDWGRFVITGMIAIKGGKP